MQVVDSTGRRRAYFPANKSGSGRQSLTSEFEIMRGDFCRLLYDAATTNKKPPRYLFGTAVASFEQVSDSVEVRFENGNTDRFDLLVGADGQWSRTRRLLQGPGVPDGLRRLPGLCCAYFTMAQPVKPGEEYLATTYMALKRRGIMTRRHSPHELQILLSCKTDSGRLDKVPRGDVKQEKEFVADIFKGAGWITDDILKAMPVADDFYLERLGLVQLQSWSSGRVTLVGDAAHCPTVLSGMGTTCAMVGAYILAGEIGRYCRRGQQDAGSGADEPDSLSAALKNYEQRYRPFVDHMQKGIPEKAESQWSMSGSAFRIGVANCLMGLASLFKINIADIFGIRETVEGWKLPEYPNMQDW